MSSKGRVAAAAIVACLAVALWVPTVHSIDNVTGTPHDFTGGGTVTFTNEDQICRPCHTPHNALTSDLLWNHTLSTATYDLHDEVASDTDVTDSSSRLCLSCHDGTVALDNYGGRTPTAGVIAGDANLGTDLRLSHPIGVSYPTTGDYRPADAGANTVAGVDGEPDAVLEDVPGGASDTVQCKSCHTVHDNSKDDFLRIKADASTICLTCHIK